MSAPARRPTLGSIRAVTYTTPDLGAVEAAYVGQLGYRVIGRYQVPEAQAQSWDAPAASGRPVLLLGPESGEPVHLRFVHVPAAQGWRALETFGWNATEFVVQDVDSLHARLGQGGLFSIIGLPKGLTRFPMIRAMQAIGPAGECCYFTEIGEGSGLDLAPALSFVGRVFIVVAAGPDADVLFQPYAAFSNNIDPPVSTPVQVISAAHDLPPDTLHAHGLVRLPGGTLIELDAYPAAATARRLVVGELAPGMAAAAFNVDDLGSHRFVGPIYDGPDGRSGCIRGATGELIELFQAHPLQGIGA